jgi:hypothetical protein
MDSPKRIQRSRAKGWKMPPNTVYVGRPTQFGNPYSLEGGWSREQVVEKYRERMKHANHEFIRLELRGKNLACWCPLNQPCHADVLLEIANR